GGILHGFEILERNILGPSHLRRRRREFRSLFDPALYLAAILRDQHFHRCRWLARGFVGLQVVNLEPQVQVLILAEIVIDVRPHLLAPRMNDPEPTWLGGRFSTTSARINELSWSLSSGNRGTCSL